jgi:AraC-like DNA-binding protein
MTARNLGEALDIAQRFVRLRSSAISLRLEREGDMALLYIDQASPDYFLGEVATFALLVGLAQMGEAATGVVLGGSADTRFAEPAYFERFAHLLNGRIRFNQPYNRLVFPASHLELPLLMADPVAAQLAREQCERELVALGDSNDFVYQVRSLIYEEEKGFRNVEQVATHLHMSERTLKRQLAQQGTTYSDILEDLRRQKAVQLLANRELSIDHIAERLGYSDVANFTRAFKRWTGETPGQYRKK